MWGYRSGISRLKILVHLLKEFYLVCTSAIGFDNASTVKKIPGTANTYPTSGQNIKKYILFQQKIFYNAEGFGICANACSALNTHRVEFPFKQKNPPPKWIPQNTQAKPLAWKLRRTLIYQRDFQPTVKDKVTKIKALEWNLQYCMQILSLIYFSWKSTFVKFSRKKPVL